MILPKLDPYLFFDGNCAEAMQFYQRTIGGRIEAMLTYGDSPEPGHCPVGSDQRIMHACIDLGGQLLMASDCPEGQPYEGMKNVALSLNYPGVDEAKAIFEALSEGGKVIMPLGPTFWAEIFGMLTDRYGTSWMIGGGTKPAAAA
jgi:PhnB protein